MHNTCLLLQLYTRSRSLFMPIRAPLLVYIETFLEHSTNLYAFYFRRLFYWLQMGVSIYVRLLIYARFYCNIYVLSYTFGCQHDTHFKLLHPRVHEGCFDITHFLMTEFLSAVLSFTLFLLVTLAIPPPYTFNVYVCFVILPVHANLTVAAHKLKQRKIYAMQLLEYI